MQVGGYRPRFRPHRRSLESGWRVNRLRRVVRRSGSGQGGHPAITQKAELYPMRSHREDRAVNDRLSWRWLSGVGFFSSLKLAAEDFSQHAAGLCRGAYVDAVRRNNLFVSVEEQRATTKSHGIQKRL